MSSVSSTCGIPGSFQSGISGIQRATKNLEKDAAAVASSATSSSTVDSRDTIGALVDSRQQLLYTRAAAKIVSTSDEVLQSLIDIRA